MASVKHDLIHGVFWSAVEKYSGVIIGICISMVLARLLSPKEYGVVAIAVVFINFISIFCTMGIGPAVIQRKDLTPKDINIIFTFTLIIGTVLGGIFFASSWAIAEFYKTPILIQVCQILSLQVFFASANMVPNALMAKNQRFKNLAKRNLSLQIICGPLAILAAYFGAGVYALLISPTITSICIFFWNRHYYPVRVCRNFTLEPIKRIFSFSIYQFLFEFVNYYSRNVDKIIIGKAMSITSLGIYDVSCRLMQYPMQNITAVINPVLHPVLKDLQENKKELSNYYNKIIKVIATLSFPIGCICYFLATDIIYIFCGSKWDAAVPIFRVLALSIPLQMILSTSGSIFMASYNTKMMFWAGIRNTSTTVAGFLIAAFCFRSLDAMAWSWTITLGINFLCTYWIMYKYALSTSLLSMLKELIKPLIIFIVLAVILFMFNSYLTNLGYVPAFILKLSVALTITLLMTQITGLFNVFALIKKRFSKV